MNTLGRRSPFIAPVIVLIVGLALLLVACLVPFDESILLRVKDGVAPEIVITSPADGASYAATVVISGAVVDYSTDNDDSGGLASATYEIVPATLPGGDIVIGDGGSFTVSFPTTGFSGTMLVRLTATDWNGNTASATLTLYDAGNDIPSLAASPGNHQITLDWDPVPLSDSYSIYFARGAYPSETYGTAIHDISPGHVLTGLQNGAPYVVLLQSHSSDGDDNWSGYVKAIPLSPSTLVPRVTGAYGRIIVEWEAIEAGADGYRVLRSTQRDDGYIDISGEILDTRFVDSLVYSGEIYFYRVEPALGGSVTSLAASGEVTPFHEDHAVAVARYPTQDARKVVVHAGIAYVADASGGLKIVDVTNPTAPVGAGSHQTSSLAWDVAVNGDGYAYIANDHDGIEIVDLANPAGPPVGVLDTAWAVGVAIDGDYLYVANHYTGLSEVYVATKSTPVETDTYATSDAWYVAVDSGYAYIASAGDGLTIVDIGTPPGNLQLAGSLGTDDAYGVTVVGDVAYLADWTSGIKIIDVQNRASPALVDPGSMVDTFTAWQVAVSESYAYVADSEEGIKVVAISDPSAPIIVGGLYSNAATGVTLDGNYLYIADRQDGLKIVEVNEPETLSVVGSAPVDYGYALAVAGHTAYVACSGYGLQMVDVTLAGSPLYQGTWETLPLEEASVNAVAVNGNFAYVADQGLGLKVIDVTDPAAPQLVGVCDTLEAYDLVVRGDYAYVADYTDGLVVIDISDSTAPVQVGSWRTNSAFKVALQDDYVYMADTSTGLIVIDVSHPETPIQAGYLTVSTALDVDVAGDYVYLVDDATLTPRLVVVDVSNPTAPVQAAEVPLANPRGITVSGNYAYVTDNDLGLVVIDITDPEQPRQIGGDPTPLARDVVVSGHYAYVSYAEFAGYGLRVIDLLP